MLTVLFILAGILGCRTVDTDTMVFNLADHINGDNFELRAPLQDAGNPSFEVVDRNVRVGNRSESWHAIDLMRDFEGSPLQIGDVVTIGGTAINAPAGTFMILGGAESPWNWISNVAVEGTQSFTIEATLTEQHLTEGQFVRFRLQTNDIGANIDFIINNWTVTRGTDAPDTRITPAAVTDPLPAPVLVGDGEAVLIYSLETDPYIVENNGTTDLSGATYLTLAGNPRVNIDGTVLELTDRTENWHTVDVVLAPIGLRAGGMYRFTATGTAPAGTEIAWHRSEAPWTHLTGLSRADAAGNWAIEATVSYPFIPEMPSMRIQTNAAPQVDLTVTSIEVYRLPVEASGVSQVTIPEWDLSLPALHELFEPFFLLGNIYSTTALMDQYGTSDAILHHFNAITAENWHKPDGIAGPGSRRTRPAPEEFDFTQADVVVDWAIENNLSLVGHALVWHSQSPQWLFNSAPNVPLTRAQALDNMEYYIRTIAEHWTNRGVIDQFVSWDVVNEVISSDGGSWGGNLDDWNAGDWRTQMRTQSGWWNAFSTDYDASAGEHPSDFVFYAFFFARRYFPNSILYYNDYNEEIPAKRNAIAQMVEQINERWENHRDYDGRMLIEGIGMQSHYHLRGWTTNLENVREAIKRYSATGAAVSITELDVTVGGYGSGNPDPDDLPALYEEQAAAYAKLFGYYLEFADHIQRVSFWGPADSQSWRAAGHPLLFDAHFNPKPAFQAIVDTVRNFPVVP